MMECLRLSPALAPDPRALQPLGRSTDGSSGWVPVTTWESWTEFPALVPSPALADYRAGIWEINQEMRALLLCQNLSLKHFIN